MKKQLKRFVSFIVATILIITVIPFYTFAQSVSFEQIVNAATYIIVYNEGNYTTVVKNDNGALSLGKICWHGTNALNLLKDIITLNPSQALSILGTSLYNEIITSSSWDKRVATSQEASALSILLATSESRIVQDETAYDYISGYVSHGQNLGISEPEALVFFADYENQNGRTGAANFCKAVMNNYGYVNLASLYGTSSKNSRRTRTYNFCASIDWSLYTGSSAGDDFTPPEIANVTVSEITDTGFTVSCDVSDDNTVSEVYFAVHHQDDGLDGVNWYVQTPSSASVSHTVNISEFSNRYGYYCVYIYVFDAAGNYAYVVLNPVNIVASSSTQGLTATVTSSGGSFVGEDIVWNASASGGSGHYLYEFSVYKDGTKVAERKPSDYSSYTYTADETGEYILEVTVYDSSDGETVSCSSTPVNIYEPIIIEAFTADSDDLYSGQTVTWKISASGGEGNLQYAYTVYQNGTAVYSTTEYSDSDTFTYKTKDSGDYYAVVNIMDSRSQVVSFQSESITVIHPLSATTVTFSPDYALEGMAVTCSVNAFGGTGTYSCIFEIYWNGIKFTTSEAINSTEFTFTVESSGEYTAVVTVTDSDSTTVTAEGGSLIVEQTAKRGDANCDGKITAADARFALRCAAQLDFAQEKYEYAVDINSDGDITANDARLILRISAGLEN